MGKYILQSALLCPTHSRRKFLQNGENIRRFVLTNSERKRVLFPFSAI
jgi:hypothetical protein